MAKKPIYEDARAEYRRLWDTMRTDAGKEASITSAAERVIAGRARYEAVARKIGPRVPWEFIGITHLMEASCDFTKHPHNGDSLAKRTWQVPAGRPPSPSAFPVPWEESAIDCYGTLKKLGDVADWPVERMLFLGEMFNGFGHRLYHPEDLTPYLWARTNHNDGTGKYVADGKYDRNAPSEGQCGFAPVLREVWRLTGKNAEGRLIVGKAVAPAVPTDAQDKKTLWKILGGVLVALFGGSAVSDQPLPWATIAIAGCLIGAGCVVVYVALKKKGVL